MVLQRDAGFEQQLRGTGCGLGLGGSGQGLSASAWEMLSSTSCSFFPIGKKENQIQPNKKKTQEKMQKRKRESFDSAWTRWIKSEKSKGE